MPSLRSPLFWFILSLITAAGLTAVGPQQASLSANVRIVYLYEAWELSAEIVLGLAAATGLLAILFRREALHLWSAGLARTGLFFWVTYLPLAVWALNAGWNDLFRTEIRFRAGVVFAVTGLLLQISLTLLARPVLSSLANVLFFAALQITLTQTAYVTHPSPAPILGSGILAIELYFIGVLLVTLMSAYFMTRWWLQQLT
jgi:hypothetical protein